MLSLDDLLLNPDDVQPLTTVKGLLNRPTHEPDVDIVAVFKSDNNQLLLANSLYHLYKNHIGGKGRLNDFIILVGVKIDEFCQTTDIGSYTTIEYQATGYNNWVEVLRAVNNEFLKYVSGSFQWNVFNPYREWIEVGASGERKQKKMSEILAEDIPTIDLHATQDTQVSGKKYRENNQIPLWRQTLGIRHYDRDNDGLQYQDPGRASLEVPTRGFDMGNIHTLIDNWKADSW